MNENLMISDIGTKVNLVKNIANKTRGPYTPEKYGNVIIPMAIIRRFDCVLAKKNPDIEELLEKLSAVANTTPELMEQAVQQQLGVPFYNSKCVTLEQLVGDSDNINSNFLEFIGAYSPSVQAILRNLKFREEVEFMIKKGILFEIVKAFSEVDFHPSSTSPMSMGYIFEEIIRTYKANAEAGDHYTPREVIELCVELMMSENIDEFNKPGKIIRVYDGCCGTGGMLTTLKRKLSDMGTAPSNIRLYGQDVNPESYAICCAEMLMLGEDPRSIREGNTLTEDMFPGEKFDLLITNPPFGVEWKTEKSSVEKELKQTNNRFVAGTPRVSDGQLLFLQNLLAKAEKNARVAIVLNGSPLFSGDAGSGESEIRRYVLENGLLEAIVALPDQMFYNTGISTYIWLLSKTPNTRRGGKIQLIDATGFWIDQKPKSLGNKRKYIDDDNRDRIVKLYSSFDKADADKTRLFDAADFGFTKVTIERPLLDEIGKPVIKQGAVQVDTSKRDTETIPLKKSIDEYIKQEVLPYVPDAFADRSKDKIGYEIPFTKFFYKYMPPRSSKEVIAEIIEKEKLINLLKEQRLAITAETVLEGLDPNVPMKDSGVEWIGEIPADWEVVRFSSLYSFGRGLSITKSDLEDEGIPCVSYGDIHSRYGFEINPDKQSLKCVSIDYVNSSPGALLNFGDIVFADTSEDIEGAGNFAYVNSENQVFAGYHTIIAKRRNNHNPRYLAYLFDSVQWRTQIRSKVYGIKVYSITQEILKKTLIVLPTKKEQDDIVALLDSKTTAIDSLVTDISDQIEKLKEYRQSLIYEVVTGKMEV